MIVRNVRFEDIEVIANINVDDWKIVYRGIIEDNYLDSLSKEKRINKLKKNYKDNSFIVAEEDGEVLGFCRYGKNSDIELLKKYSGELYAIYVKHNIIGKGIGKTLFKHVVNDFSNQGKTGFILWCLKENYNARKFYEKMGGEIVAERKFEIGGKDYDEIAFGYNI